MHKLGDLKAKERKVVVRVDWNVASGKALQILDDTRIKRTLPTLNWLLEQGAKQVTILAHLGKTGENKSLKNVARYAEKLWGREIILFETLTQCRADNQSRVKMLENVRRWEGEDSNQPEFAKELADLGEAYVNEAFGEAHRESASIVGIPRLIPGYAGLNLANEVRILRKIIENPERPLAVVMGGAKVEDKLKILEVMAEKADTLMIGGKLANEYIENNVSLKKGRKILTPVEGSDLLDIGSETIKLFSGELAKAKTIVWNGPMGKVEEEQYRAGTHAIYEALVRNEVAFTVVGGGDTLAAIAEEKHLERIDFVSTGGGAMLKFLEKGTLPGIEALK